MIQITPIAAFNDNYIWLGYQPNHDRCFVVDPGDADVVLAYLKQHNKTLDTILLTHHHSDHTGGVAELCQHFPATKVIGANADLHRINGITTAVSHGDSVTLDAFGLSFDVLSVPGHTLGHIAFYSAPVLFCGDTLFSAGCGRLFEGTAEQMWHSLQLLMSLPDETQVYCTHEYTLANIAFALTAESNNADLIHYNKCCLERRKLHQPTLPSTLALEKKINPFLRCNNKALQQEWHTNNAQDLFTALRKAKDQFKG
ncbi:MAG TPA: hydroxyacylglutathione hydrolase [Rheinheimera sp.]|nr:hydroxyacylglutathione hydrolase [Rheinheimera sp.]